MGASPAETTSALGPVVVCLRDGTVIEVRPIEPADGGALVAFHEQLSRESARLRFFNMHPHLSEREVERFTNVDHHERQAFVAVRGAEIIAVGRYDRAGDADEAEVAFVVADAWQGRGIATVLLDRLAAQARTEGLVRFTAETLCENRAMRAVFNKWGNVLRNSIEAGVVHTELALD